MSGIVHVNEDGDDSDLSRKFRLNILDHKLKSSDLDLKVGQVAWYESARYVR